MLQIHVAVELRRRTRKALVIEDQPLVQLRPLEAALGGETARRLYQPIDGDDRGI